MNYSEQNPQFNFHLIVAWVLSALFIPCLSAFGRPLQHWVYREVGQGIAAILIALCLLLLGAFAIYWQIKQGTEIKRVRIVLVSLLLICMVIAISLALPRVEERLHFVTFGVFGFFSMRLLPAWLALLTIGIWSAGDELFQAWLPDRVGDWRDVGLNVVAGIIGFGLAFRTQ